MLRPATNCSEVSAKKPLQCEAIWSIEQPTTRMARLLADEQPTLRLVTLRRLVRGTRPPLVLAQDVRVADVQQAFAREPGTVVVLVDDANVLELTLENEVGLHARPAALLVRSLAGLDAEVSVRLGDQTANARSVLAIEALSAAQALDFLKPLTTSRRGQAAHAAIRAVSPMLERDRSLAVDFERVAELISNGKLAEVLR